MRYLLSVLLIAISPFLAHSQTYEIGGMIGGANYIGDVGNTRYINPSSLAIGGLVKWNRSPRHSFRFSALLAEIKGDDAKSPNSRRQQRGYNFVNRLKEVSLGLEYTFWDFDVHSQKPISTPYLYTGLTYFGYNALVRNGDGLDFIEYENAATFAIPMVLGYKASISSSAMIGFEIGARYTFTDNLDGSNPIKEDANFDNLKFGNTNNNDWYVFTGITLTFTFGRRPCYCNF